MADINAELVGGAAVKKENNKKKKLDLKEFKLKCHIDDQFYARAHFQEFFRRPGTQLVVLLAVALITQAILAKTFTDPEIGTLYKAGIVLVGVCTFIGMPLVVKGRWRIIKQGNDFWLNDQSYTLNSKGLLAKNRRRGEHRLQWREIRKIYETNEAILFVVYKFHMVVLPLGEFSEDEQEQVREIIRYCTRNMRIKVKLNKRRTRRS